MPEFRVYPLFRPTPLSSPLVPTEELPVLLR